MTKEQVDNIEKKEENDMRSDEEMYTLILEIAKSDERVRAVGMNGSRLNEQVEKDSLQDFDIVYFVTEIASFLQHPHWIDQFGDRMIMQTPEDHTIFPATREGCFTYLMLFRDGQRIDLKLRPLTQISEWIQEDRLAKVLYDKDGLIPPLPQPSDCTFWVRKPSEKQFQDCCNEFWWLTTYVAKGIWRNQLIYAYDHLQLVRDMFLQMIAWEVGIRTNFSVSIGKNATQLQQYIDERLWEQLLETYPRCEKDEVQAALYQLTHLFPKIAHEVSHFFSYGYDKDEEQQVLDYLKKILKRV